MQHRVVVKDPSRRRSLLVFISAVLSAVMCLLAVPASAQAWSAQSLFTEDGVEVGVDARVFSLFAMLNGLGYDKESQLGPAPLFKPQFSGARQRARANLARKGKGLLALDAVLQKYPEPIARYVDAVLELGPAPAFDAKGASPLAAALAGPIGDWFSEEGGAAIYRAVADDAKASQRRLLPQLDLAIKATSKLVRLGDAQDQLLDDSGAEGRVVVILNELDAFGSLQRVDRVGVSYIVVGANAGKVDDDVVTAAVAAYARTLVMREAKKVPATGSIADVRTQLTDTKLFADAPAFAGELLACAFAKKVRTKATTCTGSVLVGQPAADAALQTLAPRVDAFAGTSAPLATALSELIAPALAATPAAPAEDAKKSKKGKG